jgi:GT2 family glycosyltransferase
VTQSYGCITLTQNQRPDDLRRAVDSLLRQRGVDVDVVVVGNGCKPNGLPRTVRSITLPENLGVPGGRNAGVPHVAGELLLFIDDDASFAEDDALQRIGEMFAADPRLGAVQPRLADPSGRPAPRRWVPRLRVGNPARSSEATLMSEAAVVVRRSAFEQVGGWPGTFFLFAEGADLAWRLQEAGYRIWYAGDVVAFHPAPLTGRRGQSRHLAARNRVWLARRNLPLPLAAAYVTGWFVRMAAGSRSVDDVQDVLRGYRDGFREPAGERRPVSWRTIWRMTRAGRPPVL